MSAEVKAAIGAVGSPCPTKMAIIGEPRRWGPREVAGITHGHLAGKGSAGTRAQMSAHARVHNKMRTENGRSEGRVQLDSCFHYLVTHLHVSTRNKRETVR